eukprot:GHRQ01036627.1.p2 GENE.GHRQ01036627.1~~GHRQ01036627.1.p2  ORF type:complete len:135 (-),score=23.51 GHRQ01036627.1:17-421(-)
MLAWLSCTAPNAVVCKHGAWLGGLGFGLHFEECMLQLSPCCSSCTSWRAAAASRGLQQHVCLQVACAGCQPNVHWQPLPDLGIATAARLHMPCCAAGSTTHVIDAGRGLVVEHIERWKSEPGEVRACCCCSMQA